MYLLSDYVLTIFVPFSLNLKHCKRLEDHANSMLRKYYQLILFRDI